MISLGGIQLPEETIWVDRFNSTQVSQTRKRSLAGRQIITALQLIAGRPITLQSGEAFGWMTKTTLDQISTLADQVGATYTLIFGVETFTVAFRHDDPPAFEFVSFVPRTTHESTDYFVGTIKLVTV